MSVRFYPVPETKLDKVFPLIEAAHSELPTTQRMTLDGAKRTLVSGYGHKIMAAYVDNLETPKNILIMSVFPGMLTEGLVAMVLLIYSLPEERGNPEVIKAFRTTIENYAKFHGVAEVTGSAWKFGGWKDIGKMWESWGFKERETIYVKEL